MQINPRYGQAPIIQIEGLGLDPVKLATQQRRRLESVLAGYGTEEWTAPSRCDSWSVQDVIKHLTSTNQFWAFSIKSGLDGDPTRFLESFDPVQTPIDLVDGVGEQSPAETLAAFTESSDRLSTVTNSIGDELWSAVAEAPPGHISLGCVLLHALWDSLIHERDVTLPLGVAPTEDSEEILAALTYVAALSPAFTSDRFPGTSKSLEVCLSDLNKRFVVEMDEVVVVHLGDDEEVSESITGKSVELLDALSRRTPITEVSVIRSSADGAKGLDQPGLEWFFDGLAAVFDEPTE